MGLVGQILAGQQRVQLIQNNNTVIQLDASLHETHSRDSIATEFPIETSDDVSDHIILKPFKLELNGIISDSPIGGLGGLLSEVTTVAAQSLIPPVGIIAGAGALALFSALANSDSPSVAAYGQLLILQEQAQGFNVITSLKRYTNMWITSISAPRDSDTGKALIFTMTMSQLLLVAPQSVNIQIFANPGLSAAQADLGQQNTLASQFKAGRLQGNIAGGS